MKFDLKYVFLKSSSKCKCSFFIIISYFDYIPKPSAINFNFPKVWSIIFSLYIRIMILTKCHISKCPKLLRNLHSQNTSLQHDTWTELLQATAKFVFCIYIKGNIWRTMWWTCEPYWRMSLSQNNVLLKVMKHGCNHLEHVTVYKPVMLWCSSVPSWHMLWCSGVPSWHMLWYSGVPSQLDFTIAVRVSWLYLPFLSIRILL